MHKPRNKSYVSCVVCEIKVIEWKFHFKKWATLTHFCSSRDEKLGLVLKSRITERRLDQGPPNFLFRGPHKQLHNISSAGHLTWNNCFGVCYFLPNQHIMPNQQVFGKCIHFHYWQNVLAGRMKWRPGPFGYLWFRPFDKAKKQKQTVSRLWL